MRVVAGFLGGRRLVSARATDLRPATDRIKETIFNILQNRLPLAGTEILDLFAGTGSLGIEAISRGAAHATFVDISEKSLRVLRSNLAHLHCEEQCTVVKAEAFAFMDRNDGQFNLIFADPPYAFEETPAIPQRIVAADLLKMGGFLIIEHSRKTPMVGSPEIPLLLQKEFGQTVVSFFSTHSRATRRP